MNHCLSDQFGTLSLFWHMTLGIDIVIIERHLKMFYQKVQLHVCYIPTLLLMCYSYKFTVKYKYIFSELQFCWWQITYKTHFLLIEMKPWI